jgi:hypothetical protein
MANAFCRYLELAQTCSGDAAALTKVSVAT